MDLSSLLPLAGIAVAVALAGTLQPYVAPAVAARMLCLVALLAALGIGWALLAVAVAWFLSFPAVADLANWCQAATPTHDPLGASVGLAATLALVVGLIRMVAAVIGFRRNDSRWGDADEVEIVPSSEIVAFAVPGRPGSIVISTATLRGLDRLQKDAVLAHEQAHLQFGHHRYIRLTRLAVSAAPVLRPVERWVELATERWADESAAEQIGRMAVADALVTMATATAADDGLLSVAGSDLARRVDALLNPRTYHPALVGASLVAIWITTGAVLVGKVVQLHHLATLAEHLCTGT